MIWCLAVCNFLLGVTQLPGVTVSQATRGMLRPVARGANSWASQIRQNLVPSPDKTGAKWAQKTSYQPQSLTVLSPEN